MNDSDIVIVISGSIARGPTSRPTAVAWRVTAGVNEPVESIGKAITEACRELNSALREAVK